MSSICVQWMGCNAEGGAAMDHEGALRSIRRVLQRSGRGGAFDLDVVTDLHLDDVGEEVRRATPELLVLSAHALKGGRVKLKDADGRVRDYAPEVVAERLTAGVAPPRLVALNVCNSEPLAKALLARGVRCVAGAGERIPDTQATSFVTRLLGALFEGASAEDAYAAAAPTDGTFGPRGDGALYCTPAPGVSRRALRFRPRAAPERRRVIVLDAYDTRLDLDAALAGLEPARRETRFFFLSERWGMQLKGSGWDASQLHWPRLANAVHGLLEDAKRDLDEREELVVVGHAPLAVNAHVGQALSSWGSRWLMLNRRKEGAWDRLEVLEAVDDGGALFREADGLDRVSQADGWVAVYVSLLAQEQAPADLSDQVRATLGSCAGVVSLLSGEARTLHQDNAEACATALREVAKLIPARYPRAQGVALFVAGPASLGLLAGRAFNVNQLRLQLWEYRAGAYVPAYCVPWQLAAAAPSLPMDADAQLRRREVLDGLLEGVDRLRRQLRPEDLRFPPAVAANLRDPQGLAALLHAKLQELEVQGPAAGEAFELSAPERRLRFGDGLLQALVGQPRSELVRFCHLFVLHELYHFEQGVGATNYRDVGRAGLVLEEVDYQADAFAVLTATLWEVRRKGEEGEETCGAILQRNLTAVFGGMEAFDRMEQGERLAVLPERRLRRYLIWALQLARARTVRRPADIEALFAARPFVELAPLQGALSAEHDKLVEGASPDTQLFVALGGRLLRRPRLPANFEPGALVEATRRFDRAALVRAMAHMVAQHGEILAPWVRG